MIKLSKSCKLESDYLESRHGVEGHPDGGDDDKHHGDEGHDVGGGGGLGVLHQVPDALLISKGHKVS